MIAECSFTNNVTNAVITPIDRIITHLTNHLRVEVDLSVRQVI